MVEELKFCIKCKIKKTLNKFSKNKNNKDGYQNWCKDCRKKYEKKYYEKHRDKILKYSKKYNMKHCKERRKKHQKYNEKHRDELNKKYKEYKIKNPEKVKARRDLSNAIRDKKIIKPDKCSKCDGNFYKIEGHHEDYNKPFDIIWLCKSCHKEIHNEKREMFCG